MHRNPRLNFWYPILFGVMIGIEVTLTSLVLLGPAKLSAEAAAQLTNSGKSIFSPERDIVIYAIGCAITILLIGSFSIIWQARLLRTDGDKRDAFVRDNCAPLCIAGVLFLIHLELLLVTRHWLVFEGATFPIFPFVLLTAPAIASLSLVGTGRTLDSGVVPRWLVRLLMDSPARPEIPRFSFSRSFDILVPLFLCAVIYIPDGRIVAGKIFVQEEFHHLDFFVMGPALAYRHGKALSTEAYSQYGLGWPMMLSALSKWIPLSYGTFIQVAAIYGCVYFVGLYFFLRLVLGSVAWATVGAFFALSLQLFHGFGPADVAWFYPSSTIMRSAMDIWFFIALAFHLRTGRLRWAIGAGVLAGLAILFETDTGIYLALTLAAYFILASGVEHIFHSCEGKALFQPLSSFISAAVVLLAGLAVASRGTILHGEFWSGWTESLMTYGAGIGMLPVATAPDRTLLYFMIVLAIYLGALGLAVIKLLRRQSSSVDVLLGCIASYGALVLILFVGRSHPSNIFHPLVPLGLIIIIVVSRITQQWSGTRKLSTLHSLLPLCLVVLLTADLFANQSFRSYPGVFHRLLGGPPAKGLCLLQSTEDVCGLSGEEKAIIDNFSAVVDVIRNYTAARETVAVLDDADTVYYLAADAKPWWRYSPSFPAVNFRSKLAELQRDIAKSGPSVVIIRANPIHATSYSEGDVWLAMHQTIENAYTLERNIGVFEIWKRNG